MSNPDWVEILHVLYEGQETEVCGWDSNVPKNHYLVTNTNLSSAEVNTAYRFLTHAGLITEDKYGITLTAEGFNVVMTNNIENRQQKTNKAILIFTAMLAFIAASDASIKVALNSSWPAISVLLLGVFPFAILLLVFVILGYRGYFK